MQYSFSCTVIAYCVYVLHNYHKLTVEFEFVSKWKTFD